MSEVNAVIKRKAAFIKNYIEKTQAHLKPSGMPVAVFGKAEPGVWVRRKRSRSEREAQQDRHRKNVAYRAELYAEFDKPSHSSRWHNAGRFHEGIRALQRGAVS